MCEIGPQGVFSIYTLCVSCNRSYSFFGASIHYESRHGFYDIDHNLYKVQKPLSRKASTWAHQEAEKKWWCSRSCVCAFSPLFCLFLNLLSYFFSSLILSYAGRDENPFLRAIFMYRNKVGWMKRGWNVDLQCMLLLHFQKCEKIPKATVRVV